MQDAQRTRDQMLAELARLRQRVSELEAASADHQAEGEERPIGALRLEHLVVQTMREGVLISNPDHTVVFANPAAAAILGIDLSELIGANEMALVPEDQRAILEQGNARRARGKIDQYSLRIETPDGTTRWLLVHASPIPLDRTDIYPGALAVFGDITPIKNANDALRESRERYRNLIETSPDAIMTTDIRGILTLANRRAAELFGVESASDLVGTPMAQWMLPQEREATSRAAFAALRRRSTRTFHNTVITPAGRRRQIETNLSVLRNVGGRPEGFLVIGRDVSELRLNEIRLQSLLELQGMQDASHQEIAAYVLEKAVDLSESATGFVAFVDRSEGGTHAIGLAADGRTEPVRMDHSKYGIESIALWKEMSVRRRPWIVNDSENIDAEILHPRGHDAIRRFACVPIVENDDLSAIVQVANKESEYRQSDIHQLRLLLEGMWRHLERREVVRALSESEAMLALALKGADLGLWHWDAPNARFSSDEHWGELLGIPPDSTPDVSAVSARFHAADLAKCLDDWQTHAESGGEEVVENQLRMRGAPGEWRWIRTRGRIVARDAENRPLRMAGTFQDITERRLLEERLQDASKLEAVGQLAGGIAHEFNNLMTIVNGYSQLMLDKLPPHSDAREDVVTIQAAGERAADLTGQLLAFSRQQPLRIQSVDLNAVLEDALRMLRPVLREDVVLETNLGPGLGIVRADPGQISQIVLNMATNARHAMPQGGRLRVSTANVRWTPSGTHETQIEPGTHVMLSVADSGCGMSPEVMARIFEPFFTTKEVGTGTGLGLSTVYGIVKQLGGEIGVESEVGVGTTFRIWFPITTVPIQFTPRPSETPRPSRPGEATTILVVEDDAQVRQLVVHVLERSGYRVTAFGDPCAARDLDSVMLAGIDLMLVDVVMPHLSGPELVTEIHARCPGIRTLYMTGYAELGSHEAANIQGAPVIMKPFRPSDLAHQVHKALNASA